MNKQIITKSIKQRKRLLRILQLRLLQEVESLQIMHALHFLQTRESTIASKHFIQHGILVQLEQLGQRSSGGANQLYLVLIKLIDERDESSQFGDRIHGEDGDILQNHGMELIA